MFFSFRKYGSARLILAAAIILLIAESAFAVKVDRTYMEVKVGKDGFAAVTENYWISFESPADELLFNDAKQRNGSAVSAWKSDYSWLYPKFGDIVGNAPTIINSKINFEDAENKIVLSYDITKQFAVLVTDEARLSLWSIPDSIFYKFINADLIRIGNNTIIVFLLPSEAIVKTDTISSLAKVNLNAVELDGALSTNAIKIFYEIRKPISGGNDFNLSALLGNESVLFGLFIAFAIVLIFGFAKRNEIKESLQNYVVKHTEFEKGGKEEEEDIEV